MNSQQHQQSKQQIEQALQNRKFLGLWNPASHFLCSEAWTLCGSMQILTIFGIILSVLAIVHGIILLATQHWIGIVSLIFGVADVYYYWIGHKGIVDLNHTRVFTFYYFCIISVFCGIIYYALVLSSSDFLPDVFGEGKAVPWMIVLWFLLQFYMVFLAWSFMVRIEAGDTETLRFGPKRHVFTPTSLREHDNNSVPQVAEGRIVEVPRNEQNNDAVIQMANVAEPARIQKSNSKKEQVNHLEEGSVFKPNRS
mmetsp:Transcript_46999/g.54180  ORF Transcript_46999/g.54180 Transcript_46999/m.54180 type:complete len:253 (-) Transcript_46999:123-881(-)